MQNIRYLDRLIDELAKRKAMEKILRESQSPLGELRMNEKATLSTDLIIDMRFEAYESFFDHDWAKAFGEASNVTTLRIPAFDLMRDWKGIAVATRMCVASKKGRRRGKRSISLQSDGVTFTPMKRREMNSLAKSLCAYLASRNNDIAGYWGIGMLCAISKREGKPKFSFKLHPGQLIRIYGCEITDSTLVTEKLVKFDLDSIEGRLSFFEDGRYPHRTEKYTCGIAIAITQGGRTGLSLSHVACWPHDPSRERRRAGFDAKESTWFTKLTDIWRSGSAGR